MNNSYYRLTFDIYSTRSNTVIRVKKGDNSRILCIALTEDGKVYDIDESCVAVFRGKKQDGNPLYSDCIIENNTIRYAVTDDITSNVGIVDCEIRLISGGKKILSTPNFVIMVTGSTVD